MSRAKVIAAQNGQEKCLELLLGSGEKVDQAMKEEMTEVAAAEAVREETVKTEGTAVAEKETEENGRVAVASDPVAEKEDRVVRARKIMVR